MPWNNGGSRPSGRPAGRHVRNPIHLGVVIFLLGYVFWYPTRTILLMAGLVSICSHLFVILYAETRLRRISVPPAGAGHPSSA